MAKTLYDVNRYGKRIGTFTRAEILEMTGMSKSQFRGCYERNNAYDGYKIYQVIKSTVEYDEKIYRIPKELQRDWDVITQRLRPLVKGTHIKIVKIET